MSTYWGFRCEQCNEDSPAWFNHGQPALREIIALWDAIAVIQKSTWLEVKTLMFVDDDPMPFDFIEKHLGHRVVLRNEYGDVEQVAASPAPTASMERVEGEKLT